MEKKQQLTSLFQQILEDADSSHLDVLERLLNATGSIQKGSDRTYINAALEFKGELTDQDTYVATINLNPFFMNALDILHGGITTTFADTAMGTLVAHLLPDHQASVTSEIKMNYLRPGIGEQLICEAEVIHRGKHLWVTSSKIMDTSHNIVAYASGSFFVIDKPLK